MNLTSLKTQHNVSIIYWKMKNKNVYLKDMKSMNTMTLLIIWRQVLMLKLKKKNMSEYIDLWT